MCSNTICCREMLQHTRVKDQVTNQAVILSDDLFQLDNVGMTKFSQRLNFTESNAFVPTVILFLHPLDSHDFARLFVDGSNNFSVCPISKTLCYLIAVHTRKSRLLRLRSSYLNHSPAFSSQRNFFCCPSQRSNQEV
mmetsp:Transcript_10991/g.37312  ORF Transcript_10991/g.37312 Transcript_10991/m.37312 type:complete len:137 (+) Transcript_10991:1891-2301(+)